MVANDPQKREFFHIFFLNFKAQKGLNSSINAKSGGIFDCDITYSYKVVFTLFYYEIYGSDYL